MQQGTVICFFFAYEELKAEQAYSYCCTAYFCDKDESGFWGVVFHIGLFPLSGRNKDKKRILWKDRLRGDSVKRKGSSTEETEKIGERDIKREIEEEISGRKSVKG
ncbi:MAG: hypothetical protein LIP08_14570 [Bacteroides sp.]|nr:hypothetical protein [Bacteroides sp.]